MKAFFVRQFFYRTDNAMYYCRVQKKRFWDKLLHINLARVIKQDNSTTFYEQYSDQQKLAHVLFLCVAKDIKYIIYQYLVFNFEYKGNGGLHKNLSQTIHILYGPDLMQFLN